MKKMKELFKKSMMAIMLGSMFLSVPVMAASGEKFSFKFTDLRNYVYPTSWLKQNTADYYKITLNKKNGLTKNNMSASNIFGCRMKDMSIIPVVDRYHTFSNYVSDYQIYYMEKVSRGDTMVLGAKKDSGSKSGDNLKISGSVTP